MKHQQSIALIICYYGEFPWYFSYFVHSCKHNPSINFYIITDNKTLTSPLPDNVKLIYKTLEETSFLATQKLGFEVSMDYSYKLCDFKPAYGFIFSEILKDYDFWGYGDLDVIFGNIRNFATETMLENYDLMSIQPYWLPGCFSLFRNTPKLNTLFMQSKDYEKVFRSRKHYCFDETNFTHDQFNDGLNFHQVNAEIESMTHVVKKMEEINYIRPYFDLHIIEGNPGNITWDRGDMIYKNKYEALLYHLIDFKKHFVPPATIGFIPDSFAISRTKIHHKPKHINNKVQIEKQLSEN
jgi:hypothetical protein